MVVFWFNWTKIRSHVHHESYASIRSDYDSPANMRQAFIWNNDGPVYWHMYAKDFGAFITEIWPV